MATDPLDDVRALFSPAPGTIYLDTATYGLPPRPTVEALHQAVDGWQSATANWVAEWDQRGEACRAAYASLTGTDVQNVALMPSASVGVGLVAATHTDRDEVVIPDVEFNSVLFPMLVAAEARGTLMDHHLRHVEAGLSLSTPERASVDLREVLGATLR